MLRVYIFFLITLANSLSACANELVFTTIFGEELTIQFHQDGAVATKHGHIVTSTPGCNNDTYTLCFFSRVTDVVMPKNPPKVNDNWELYGSTFNVVNINDEILIFGKKFYNLYTIKVEKGLGFQIKGTEKKTKTSRFYYSYKDGLIALKEKYTSGNSVLYLRVDVDELSERQIEESNREKG